MLAAVNQILFYGYDHKTLKNFRPIPWKLNIAYHLECMKSSRMILVSLAELGMYYGLRTLRPSTCRLVIANNRCAGCMNNDH